MWPTIKELAMLRRGAKPNNVLEAALRKKLSGGGHIVWKTVGPSDILTVTDAVAAPMQSLIAHIAPVQEGSGDPSPDNVRPITGWTGATVYQSGADTSDPTTIPVTWLSEAGTVYGGTVDLVSGVLTVTSVGKHLSALTWVNHATEPNMFNGTGFTERKQRINGSNENGCYCDSYKWQKSSNIGASDGGIALANGSTGSLDNRTRIYLKDTRFSTYSEFVASFTTYDPLVVCPLETPETYQLTTQDISTLAGVNNVWADCGQTEMTYAAKTSGELDEDQLMLLGAIQQGLVRPGAVSLDGVDLSRLDLSRIDGIGTLDPIDIQPVKPGGGIKA